MVKVSAWPARRGDSLLVEYGEGAGLGRIMIDCGFKTSYADQIRPRLQSLEGPKQLKALLITHVDLDHINGVLEMLEDPACPVTFADVWFNAFEHLKGKRLVTPKIEDFGGAQGEELSVRLITDKHAWNAAFDGRPVTTTTPMTPIDTGLQITVLSPTAAQLTQLIDKWVRECEKAGVKAGFDAEEPTGSPFEQFGAPTVDDVRSLATTPFVEESSESNGSTIALLVEHDLQRALLTGDANTSQLIDAIGPLAQAEGGRLRLDLMQVPHHGSRGNLSKELVELVDCRRYIVSSDGSTHGHPHDETIARILMFGGAHHKTLYFNYRDRSERWRSGTLQEEFDYEVVAPEASDDGAITIDLAQP